MTVKKRSLTEDKKDGLGGYRSLSELMRPDEEESRKKFMRQPALAPKGAVDDFLLLNLLEKEKERLGKLVALFLRKSKTRFHKPFVEDMLIAQQKDRDRVRRELAERVIDSGSDFHLNMAHLINTAFFPSEGAAKESVTKKEKRPES